MKPLGASVSAGRHGQFVLDREIPCDRDWIGGAMVTVYAYAMYGAMHHHGRNKLAAVRRKLEHGHGRVSQYFQSSFEQHSEVSY